MSKTINYACINRHAMDNSKKEIAKGRFNQARKSSLVNEEN